MIDLLQNLKPFFVALICTMLFTAQNTYGQKKFWDVIMLNSAEVVRGTITDSISENSLTILAGDTLSRIIPRSSIALITKEVMRLKRVEQSNNQSEKNIPGQGIYYQGILTAGFGLGIGVEKVNGIKANFINGIGFSNIISFGAGIGIRLPLQRDVAVVPLFFDMRIRPLNTRISPFFAMGIGSCFQPDLNWDQTGTILNIEGGISIKNTGKSAVMLTIGYESYEIINTSGNGGFNGFSFTSKRRETIGMATLNFGVAF